MRRSYFLVAFVAILALVATTAAGEPAADLATYRQHVKPLLDRTCVECHSAKVQKGNFRVDNLDPDIVHGKTLHGWEEVLNKTQVLEMPPPKHAIQPTSDERQKLLSWLRQELRLAAKVHSSTGGQGAMRRLTRTEYVQSMKDLLGVTIVDFGQGFPEENRNRETGFANDSREMSFNTTHLAVLLDRARAGLAEALVTGGKPPGLKATLKPAPGRNNNDGEVRKHRTNDVLVETVFDLPIKVPWHEEPQLNGSITLLDGAIVLPRVFRDMIGSGAVMGGGVRWHMGAYKVIPRIGELRVVAKVSGRPDGDQIPNLRVDIGRAENESPHQFVGQALVTSATPTEIEFRMPWQLLALPDHGHVIFIRQTEPDLLMDPLATPAMEARYLPDQKKKTTKLNPILLLHEATVEIPYYASWPPPSHVAIVGNDSVDDAEGVKRILARFMQRAWRRPPTSAEVETFLDFHQRMRAHFPGPIETLRETLANVLINPNFVYFTEPVRDGAERTPLNAWALASRLSFGLTGTLPDPVLHDACAKGVLISDAGLRHEAERLLADPCSDRFLLGFADAYLGLHALDNVNINPEFFTAVEPGLLKEAMRDEARHFVATVFRKNLPSASLINADFLVVDRRMARQYGIPLVPGNDFVAVPEAGSGRQGGILHLSAVHLMNSTGEHSHPIKRAVWFRRNLLDQPPGDPPPAVPSVPEDFSGLSLTQRLIAHRNKDACRDCHASIDPYGLPFERYDPTGLPRNEARSRYFVFDMSGGRHTVWTGQAIECTSTLPDGTAVNGLDDLRKYLGSAAKERFDHSLVNRLASYLLGRTMEFSDQSLLDDVAKRWTAAGGGTRDLVIALVLSPLFRTR
ncbi:hypothetical protein LBMAG53_20180 [Planctomycetota bacterium]|nr:hypothetical protein LBMAG53_20180 [Planctomycetota bacterium]